MEPWAQRIKDLLDADARLSQTGLAAACGAKQPSISQWFNNDTSDKPPTKMLSGGNLVAAARYLGTTPEYIMTGRGAQSHSVRINPETLATANTLLQKIAEIRRTPAIPDINAEALAVAYEVVQEATADLSNDNVFDFMKRFAERL